MLSYILGNHCKMTTDFSSTSQPSGGNATLKSQKNEYQADQSSTARPDLNKQTNKIQLPKTNILQTPSRRNASSPNWVSKNCIRNPTPRSKFHHENTPPILRTRGPHTQDCFLPVPLHLAISIQQVPYYSDIQQVVAKFYRKKGTKTHSKDHSVSLCLCQLVCYCKLVCLCRCHGIVWLSITVTCSSYFPRQGSYFSKNI